MLRQLISVENFRGLNSELMDPNVTFAKNTIIFGPNGSGKSSVSEFLRTLSEERGAPCSVTVSNSILNSTARKIKPGETVESADIRVFNHFYVDEKLRAFLDAKGQSETIFKLGDNADAASAQLVAQEFVKLYQSRLLETRAATRKDTQTSKQIETTFKEQVVETLGKIDAQKYSSYRFDVRVARNHLLAASHQALSSEEYNNRLSTATMTTPDKIGAISLPEIPISRLFAQLRLTTSRLNTAIIIDELAANPSVDDWVRIGLDLHDSDSECKFCRGTLTEERRQNLRNHFDDSSTRSRQELADLSEECAQEHAKLELWKQDLPKVSAFYPDLQESTAETITKILSWVTARQEELTQIRELSDEKLENFYEPIDLPSSFPEETAPIEELSQKIDTHNHRAADHSKTVMSAASDIVSHLAARHCSQYKSVRARMPRLASLTDKIETRLNHHLALESRYKAAQTDATAMALLIDEDVKNVFGRPDLHVLPSPDATGYIITRHGKPAFHLSEGERKIIALSYFLRSLEADDVDRSRLSVVIDDPVSSLDRENMYAAFSWLNDKIRDCPQTIILTHDFELLRLYISSTSNQRRTSLRKMGEGDNAEIWFPRVNFLELSRGENPAHPERCIQLKKFPAFLLQHNSEYHYLFYKVVATARSDGDDTLLPLVGNASRRLLEGFATFEGPAGASFQQKIDMACQGKVDNALKNRVVKFAHGQSHRENPNPTTGVDLPSVRAELQALLNLIQKCNPVHFERMCKATEINPDW